MGQISLQIPQVGLDNSTEDPKVASDFTTLQTLVNGNLDASNLTTGLALLLKTTGTARKVAFGFSNLTFTASQTSAEDIVNHGLGLTPQVAFAIAVGWLGFVAVYGPADGKTVNSTDIALTGYNISGAISSTKEVFWIAIG